MRLIHSSASEVSAISTNSSATLLNLTPRRASRTPGLCLRATNSAKCVGIVDLSCVTSTRLSLAAISNTPRSSMPSSPAAVAVRKSTSACSRIVAETIFWFRSASAWKRIFIDGIRRARALHGQASRLVGGFVDATFASTSRIQNLLREDERPLLHDETDSKRSLHKLAQASEAETTARCLPENRRPE